MFAARNMLLTPKPVAVPLSLIGVQPAGAATVTIPTHSPGDVIVIFARTSSGLPTTPTAGGTVPTWTAIDATASTTAGCKTAYCVATAANHTSGTWTGADGMIAVVLRGANASPIGGHAVGSPTFSPSNTCPAPSITLSNNTGTSMLLHFFGWGDATSNITAISTAPSGYTQRTTGIYASNKVGVCLDTKDVTTSDGAVSQVSTSTCWYNGATVEILAA